MKIAEIQNGLSYAGRLRGRNYEERTCCPDKRKNIDTNCSYGKLVRENMILKHALRDACRIIATDDCCAKNFDRLG